MLTLYVHQAAKSTFQSCRWISTLPAACAKSQPTTQPWKCMRYSIRCTSHNCTFITPKCALSSLKQPYMTSYCVWCDTKVAWTCSLTQTVSKLSAHTSGRRIFHETSPPPTSLTEYLFLGGFGDDFHVEQLPGVVLHPRQHHHCYARSLTLQNTQYIFQPKRFFTL